MFHETVKLWDLFEAPRALFICLLVCSALACGGEPDPRSVDGVLAKVAASVARRDAKNLFRVIDQRARHAMASIVASRREAAEIIRRSYPQDQRKAALAQLGDAQNAQDAADLFAQRCTSECFDALSQTIAAPAQTTTDGDELVVTTARGSELRLFRGSDTWYGLVWNTKALIRERDRAAAERDLVRENGETFAKQNALQDDAP